MTPVLRIRCVFLDATGAVEEHVHLIRVEQKVLDTLVQHGYDPEAPPTIDTVESGF